MKLLSFIRLSLLCMVMLCAVSARASHFYGADLFYTYVSGSTYKVTLVAYGDCSGSAFSSFSTATPDIVVTDQAFYSTTITLSIQAPTAGTEVTPVCASQLSNTTCVSTTGTIPGVKKFTYSANVTLPHTSSNWLFRFDGIMGSNVAAGRSNSLTNVVSGTIMALEATLDNTSGNNSSPVYTTIPTPFFCINKAASYNPGAVDPNSDSLGFSLVDGLVQTSSTPISYVWPRTGTSPIAASTGTFSFSNTTGQLNFTPNITQRALVVNTVSEYRNGVLVGTSMREMTFVVISPCSNNPPGGNITGNSAGTLIDTVTLAACKSSGTVTFSINPSDLDGDVINMVANGLPSGATLTISSNNTTAPTGAFSWNITNVAAGSYNFFVTYTDNGCPLSSKQTVAYTINVLPSPGLAFTLVSPATCTKKAVFKVTPSGPSSPWTFTVRQGTTTIHTFSGLTGSQVDSVTPGTYTLRFANSSGCYKDTTIVFANPPVIVPSVVVTSPTCHGGNNGRIVVSATGGLSPFRFAIGSGAYSSSNTFTGLAAGTYIIHVKDGNDCTKDTNVVVIDALDIVAQISVARPTCNYYGNGTITVKAINGTSPYQYSLGSGAFSTTNTFTGLSGGNHLIHIKDANNCTKDTLFALKDSINVHAVATVTNVLCNGYNTGAITLNANSGTPAYQYQLGSGTLSATNTFTTLTAGSYTFHIEDQYKCFLDTVVTITEPTLITNASIITNVLCHGGSTGTVNVVGSGGVSPYTYAMGSGTYSSSGAYSGLPIGTYTFHIKDKNQCVRDTVIIITQPQRLVISDIVQVNAKCNGSSDGSFTVTASGGTPGYTYSINSSAFTSSNLLSGLPAGTHTIHLKDANGCLVDSVRNILQPTPIIPKASLRNSTCATLADGIVNLSATGGTPGYTYAVNAGTYSTTTTFSALNAATYTFHIKDGNNCIKDTIIKVVDSLNVDANVNVTDANCYRETTGVIQVMPTGGQTPYTFALNSGAYGSSNLFSGLGANTYSIHIKDNNGCLKDINNVVINEPTRIVPSVVITDELCYKYNNGSIQVSATGGIPAYTFAVNTGAYNTNPLFPNLYAGTYTVHVKDAHGCVYDTVVKVTEPTGIEINSLIISNLLCYQDASGKVTIGASGGNPPLQYSPDQANFQASNILTGLKAGDHYIRVRDNNNCVRDTLVTLTEPPPLLITGVVVTNPTCEGYADGEVVINASGGTPAYKYAYGGNAPQPSPTIQAILEGTYTFSVIDNNGCKHDTSLILTGYPPILVNNVTTTPVSCFGYEDGAVSIDASGGTRPLKYIWGTVQSLEPQFTGMKAGEHVITITDNNNCSKNTLATITSPDALAIKLTVTSNDCEGYGNRGAIASSVEGGTEPYSYTWANTQVNTPEIKGINNGFYTLVVKDANECTDSANAKVTYDNCCKIFIPDAFTPNSDGKNDKVKILYKGDMQLKVFAIYNRFGQKVFSTNINGDGWDGTFNGTPQEMGVYNYYAKAICGSVGSNEVEYKGTITLIR